MAFRLKHVMRPLQKQILLSLFTPPPAAGDVFLKNSTYLSKQMILEGRSFVKTQNLISGTRTKGHWSMPIWSERVSERKVGIDNDGESWKKRFNHQKGLPVR